MGITYIIQLYFYIYFYGTSYKMRTIQDIISLYNN